VANGFAWHSRIYAKNERKSKKSIALRQVIWSINGVKAKISDLSIGQSFVVAGSMWVAREWRSNGSLEAEPIGGKAFDKLNELRGMNAKYNNGQSFIPHKIFAAFAANRIITIEQEKTPNKEI